MSLIRVEISTDSGELQEVIEVTTAFDSLEDYLEWKERLIDTLREG